MRTAKPNHPIRLYTTALSGHGHRVQLMLSLLDLPYDVVEVDLRSGVNRTPDFLRLSPFGQIPVIEDGETVLYDSNAILTYLAKRYGDAHWLPDDPVGAARVQQWLSLAAGQIAYGPATARVVNLFGVELDHANAVKISVRLFDVIEPLLGRYRFATGEQATIADVAGYSYIAHAPEGGISLAPYPNIRAWLARVAALPGFVAMPSSKIGLLAA